jgi:hypothetical protein
MTAPSSAGEPGRESETLSPTPSPTKPSKNGQEGALKYKCVQFHSHKIPNSHTQNTNRTFHSTRTTLPLLTLSRLSGPEWT